MKKVYELIQRSKKGDKEAFTEIIRNMDKDLYKIAKARLNNEDDIADAIQETIIKAFKSIKKLKYDEYFKTWVIRILINNCNLIYKKKNKKEISFENLQNKRHLTYSDIEKVDSSLDFEYIIEKLNYNEKIVLNLYYGEGYTSKEISKILGAKESTIKSRILRAKDRIRKMRKEIKI